MMYSCLGIFKDGGSDGCVDICSHSQYTADRFLMDCQSPIHSLRLNNWKLCNVAVLQYGVHKSHTCQDTFTLAIQNSTDLIGCTFPFRYDMFILVVHAENLEKA